MLVRKFIFIILWSLIKMAVENRVSRIILDVEKAKNDTTRHKIVTIFGNFTSSNYPQCRCKNPFCMPEGTYFNLDNSVYSFNNHCLKISNSVLLLQKVNISGNLHIPITIDYYLDSADKNRYANPSLKQTSSQEVVHYTNPEINHKDSIYKEIDEHKYNIEYLNRAVKHEFSYLITLCNNIQNLRKPQVIIYEIERIFLFSFNLKNSSFDRIFRKNYFIFYCLNEIERKMKQDIKDSHLLNHLCQIFFEKMNLIKIAEKKYPILSFFPGLIFLKDFILYQVGRKSIKEGGIFSVYYGYKMIESIIIYNSKYLTEVDSNHLYGNNFEHPDYKLNKFAIRMIYNHLGNILYVIKLIRKVLLQNEDYNIIELTKHLSFYLKNDFLNNKYSKNTISRCVLDLVFLFDDETIKYLTEYYYILDRVTYKYRVICQGSSDDKKYFSFNESLKFIQYYLKLFKSETFKKYIRMSEAEYNQYMIKFEEIKNDIYNDLKDISIREKIFIALEKYHIFIRYNMNLRFNSLIFTEEYKTKMNNYYKDLKMTE